MTNYVEDEVASPDSSGLLSNEAKSLAAAARGRRKYGLSVAVTIVSIGAISYACCILYLCRNHAHPDDFQKEFYEQVPQNVYLWPMVAFATTMLLNTLSWIFEQRPARKKLSTLAVYISAVAFLYEFLAWAQMAPIFITATGRPNSMLRYVMWAHATPAMLYALSLISDFSNKRVGIVIIVDIFMILTAIPGELIPHWSRWVWNFASCAVFPFIFHELWCMYGDAIHGAGENDRAAQVSLRALQGFTVTFWTLFPIIWTLVQLQWVSIRTEEILWSIADISGKIFFSSSLLHSNFMTIDSRRLMAMRAVEEANRTRVIQELRQLVEQKEAFIALMSHELRTPLNGIIGLSNALLMDVSPDAETGRTLATIRNSGARLLNLINDILDAAALRKGRLVVGRNRILLQHAVDDVIELTAPLTKHGVTLTGRVPADTPAVLGDASRLVQILYNLVGNACKFTEKGEIWVGASVSEDGDNVIVEVHDTGIGIPREKLEDIFSPFEQVDMSARRQYGGTGLGLNLAKQLVEAHGGTIVVASHPGKGSTFTFTLKVWKEGQDPVSQRPQPAQRRFAWQRPSMERRREIETNARASHPSITTEMPAEPIHSHRIQEENEEGERAVVRSPGHSREVVPMPFRNETNNSEKKKWRIEEEESVHRPSEETSESYSMFMPRNPSAIDLIARLSHDADRGNMLHRLSLDAAARQSYEVERNLSFKAPQQMDPSEAAASFFTASVPIRTTSSPLPGGSKSGEIQLTGPPSPPPSSRGPLSPTTRGEVLASWQDAAEAVAEAERAGAVTVLSVDDDPINQMVIQAMLRRAGFKVVTASDGHKALDLLASGIEAGSPPDMMLLDVMMPGLSGYDVVRLVREKYPGFMLPVILVSANGHEDQVVEGLQAGANDYITKPFGQRELVARILTQLRTKSFAEAAAARAAAAAASPATATSEELSELAALMNGDDGVSLEQQNTELRGLVARLYASLEQVKDRNNKGG